MDRPRITRILNELATAFSGTPWYGHGVTEKLNTLAPEAVHTRVHPKSHTIAEVVTHMTNWKLYVLKKAAGNADYEIAIDSPQDWSDAPDDWQGALRALHSAHRELVDAVSSKSDDWLDQTAPGTKFNNEQLLRGIIDHDIYHLGQIGSLNKMLSFDLNRDL